MAHISNLEVSGPATDYGQSTLAKAEPVLEANGSRGFYRHRVKRAIDIVAVLLVAPFLLPVIATLAVLIRRDGGPVFYVQDRIGRDGRRFRLWKLRTMVIDAEAYLHDYLLANPEARREWDRTQKLKHDPRITGLGRLLRKISLDELPQLWNVLRGDMSLVGPRPMLPEQQGIYPGRAYYRLRPGLTGFWQISRRNETSFARRAAYDAEYARRMSLLTDVLVMIQTVRVVIRGTGY